MWGFTALNEQFFWPDTAKQSFLSWNKAGLNDKSFCFSLSVSLMYFLCEECLCSGSQCEKMGWKGTKWFPFLCVSVGGKSENTSSVLSPTHRIMCIYCTHISYRISPLHLVPTGGMPQKERAHRSSQSSVSTKLRHSNYCKERCWIAVRNWVYGTFCIALSEYLTVLLLIFRQLVD